ncbi:MAG: galactitol-1-phosphate 5-dehydrogenase [Lachnospiraceae bacterium]|nr:galactitol-1-phosphate 5-dehydrogenase [Lachnospiraceae bacterium]
MKAHVLKAIGDIQYQEVLTPAPKPGEVLVKVQAAGICGSDLPRVFETGAHNMPLIPGHEFSGIVQEIGEGAEAGWIGKRVGVFPLIPCKDCVKCHCGHYELCSHYDYLGSRRNGGFAEYVTVPAWNLIELPDTVSFEEGAMLEPLAVGIHALRLVGEIPKNAKAAICGLGPIGLLLAMVLKAEGFENIYVIGNKDHQKKLAEKIGIPSDCIFDNRREDAANFLAEAGGMDLFFECVGRKESLQLAINAAAPLGKVVLVGNPHSDMPLPKDIYWKILRKQLCVYGSWNSAFGTGEQDDWHHALRLLKEGKLLPADLITHRVSLDGLKQALCMMRDKSEDYSKVMVSMG